MACISIKLVQDSARQNAGGNTATHSTEKGSKQNSQIKKRLGIALSLSLSICFVIKALDESSDLMI